MRSLITRYFAREDFWPLLITVNVEVFIVVQKHYQIRFGRSVIQT
jgi:hypothetical protein